MRLRAFGAVLTAVLLTLSFPRADLGWLGFVALVPLLLAIRGTSPREAAWIGFLTGAVFFAGLLYWITSVMTRYAGLQVITGTALLGLLVAYLAIYPAVFAAIVAAGLGRAGTIAYLAAPFVWTGLELLRGRLLTGFPWGLIGATQWRHAGILQAGALGGVALVSWLVVLANAAFTMLLTRPATRRERIAAAASLVLVIGSAAAGARVVARLPDGDGEAIPVAAIQANVPQDRKWRPEEQTGIVTRLVDQSREAVARGARLVVWPESSSPLSYNRPAGEAAIGVPIQADRNDAARVGEFVRESGVTLVAGAVQYRYTGTKKRAYNSAFIATKDGGAGETYDKVHLVPFGEYVPMQRILFFVNRLVEGAVSDFGAGTRIEPLQTPLGEVGPLICYEAIFPEHARLMAPARFLVNLTNDAWFGMSAGPRQHLALATVRAAENHRWMLRAANTGISAIVDPAGRVVAETPLEEERVLVGTLHARADVTPYAARGDVFGWGCVIVAAVAAFRWRAGSAGRN